MDNKGLIEGIAIGAVAGAVATILLAPKVGKETRDEISSHLSEIKNGIVNRLADAGEFTRARYEEIVTAVVSEYEMLKTITTDEAKEIEANLHEGYEAVKATISEQTPAMGAAPAPPTPSALPTAMPTAMPTPMRTPVPTPR